MVDHQTVVVVKNIIKEINTGKTSGFNGIPIEIIIYGGDKLTAETYNLISDVWLGAAEPHDRVDGNLINLRKLEIGCCWHSFWKPFSRLVKKWKCPSIITEG